ncbi:oligosaccharide flippase family protein [Oceanobacter antarcticus]|uniref:Oligosaccharide flippase family protein n=1 Tax=Oceanobacter antarcticus TaxID=3133425 RepID=A0ABW8NEM0_9GAMM
MATGSVKQAGIWTSVQQFGSQVCFMLVTVFLARLLSPEDFGLVAMVTVIIGFISYLSEPGIINYIVKNNYSDKVVEDTAFWLGLMLGGGVYFLVYILSPVIAWFFSEAELTDLTRVLSLSIIFNSFGFVSIAIRQKNLDYMSVSIIRIISILVSGAIAIYAAFNEFDAYAIAFYWLALSICTGFGSFLLLGWRPTSRFDKKVATDILVFGKSMVVMNIINSLSENLDKIIIGKFVGSMQLGIYSMAYRISKYPLEKFRLVVFNVLLPVYSQVQGHKNKVAMVWGSATIFISLLFFSFSVFLYYTSGFWIRLLLGEQWSACEPIVKIISFFIFFWAISLTDLPLLIVLEKVALSNKIRTVFLLIGGIGSFIIAYFYGELIYVASFYFGSLTVGLIIVKIYCWMQMKDSLTDFLSNISVSVVVFFIVLVLPFRLYTDFKVVVFSDVMIIFCCSFFPSIFALIIQRYYIFSFFRSGSYH